jgi:biofilm PGA synthesis N-glycosyltransferase PgaC
MAFLFWFFLVLIIYCFFGYPLLLVIAGTLFNRPVNKSPIVPSISIVISVWNEEDVIERKIQNLLGLDYPPEKMEILIGSDGSDDRTNAIVQSIKDPRLILIERNQRRGKMATINELVAAAKHEVIVFNDARQEIAKDALRRLAANLADPAVGCVSGELVFHKREGATAKGINLYWEYEKFMRDYEARIHSMLGATGAIYAIRKELFAPVPPDTVLDDMYIPFKIIEKGLRAVFESEAHAYDHVADNPKEEYRRKTRTLYGNFQIFGKFIHLFNPFQSPVAIQFFSHKFLRVVVPFLMVALLLINAVLLGEPLYNWIMLLQILFYAMAGVGAWGRNRKIGMLHYVNKVCYIPYVFCLLNFSVFIGFWRFIHSKQEATWQKAREQAQ